MQKHRENGLGRRGRAELVPNTIGAEATPVTAERTKSETSQLMEAVVERNNLWLAYQRVVGNRGAPGVDGLEVTEFKPWLKAHWPQVKQALLSGQYMPRAVRKVDIPKPNGGIRTLGIPTVLDRLIQQALHQVLQPIFEPEFSESSYGFRPGRSAHQAVQTAREYVAEGRRWVVDIDLEKFFDRVNHDILMSRLARKVEDKRALKLIRRYLEAGMMEEGIASPRREGTPQGGPLSPLLSNILLTDLDRELERRGHCFCRYADDCNIYVGSEKAGMRVMASITEFLQKKLKLKINAEKSAVGKPWKRKFLGYTMSWHQKPKLWVAKQSRRRFVDKVRKLFRGAQGRSLATIIQTLNPVLRGWGAYFHLAEQRRIWQELDMWVRRRLRIILWRQWKNASTRARNMMRRGVEKRWASSAARNGRGPWYNSGSWNMKLALPKPWFDEQGLVSLEDYHGRFQRV